MTNLLISHHHLHNHFALDEKNSATLRAKKEEEVRITCFVSRRGVPRPRCDPSLQCRIASQCTSLGPLHARSSPSIGVTIHDSKTSSTPDSSVQACPVHARHQLKLHIFVLMLCYRCHRSNGCATKSTYEKVNGSKRRMLAARQKLLLLSDHWATLMFDWLYLVVFGSSASR